MKLLNSVDSKLLADLPIGAKVRYKGEFRFQHVTEKGTDYDGPYTTTEEYSTLDSIMLWVEFFGNNKAYTQYALVVFVSTFFGYGFTSGVWNDLPLVLDVAFAVLFSPIIYVMVRAYVEKDFTSNHTVITSVEDSQ